MAAGDVCTPSTDSAFGLVGCSEGVDERAVGDAFQRYAPAVYARCVHLLRSRDAARDVTQEVFVRCMRERGALRPGRELLAWLYRVATNLCLNQLRAGRLRAAGPLDEAQASAEPPGPNRHLAARALAGLDERTQAIAIYVIVDGMTHAEAAEVAGVTDRTVRNCLARFRAHGREALGYDPDARRDLEQADDQEDDDEEEDHDPNPMSVRLQSGRP
jgi:RNA polymerase sigma-70 factor (ECF subfamily)